MKSAALQAVLTGRFAQELQWRSKPAVEVSPSGIAELDSLIGGFPRGSISELYGPASSGRTSLLHAALAEATSRQECCALVDVEDTFDPVSASNAGVQLPGLLWVRCGHSAENALKVTDLLLQGGGFGMVAIDLGDTPLETARRISLASWFRFRQAAETANAVLLVVEQDPLARTAAVLSLEARREAIEWTGNPGYGMLLGGVRVQLERRKPAVPARASFQATAMSA